MQTYHGRLARAGVHQSKKTASYLGAKDTGGTPVIRVRDEIHAHASAPMLMAHAGTGAPGACLPILNRGASVIVAMNRPRHMTVRMIP
jgi:hypothetical protein